MHMCISRDRTPCAYIQQTYLPTTMSMDRLDVDAVLARYLFPNAPKRLAEYLVAREQYDLTSAMARNHVRAIIYVDMCGVYVYSFHRVPYSLRHVHIY